jgi:hypothetical protein
VSVPPGRLELYKPRDVGELLTDGFGTYFRNFGTFVGISAAVVIPVQLIVSGIGLEQLWRSYDSTPSVAVLILPAVVTALVVSPLVTAMTTYALLDIGEGRPPSARSAIQRGLDVFTPLFFTVLLAALGIAAGLVALIIPGIFVGIRWYFVAQAVVVEDKRGMEALRRSWELVKGSSWRVLGILLMVGGAIAGASQAIQAPLGALSDAADSTLPALIGLIVTQTLAVPAGAVIAALFYFDLRARREGHVPGGGGWPAQPPQWPQPPAPPGPENPAAPGGPPPAS